MTLWLVSGAIFLGVTLAVIAAALILRDRRQTQDLSDRLDMFTGNKPVESDLPSLLREPIDPEQGARFTLGSPIAWLRKLILQADLRFGPAPLLAGCAGLAIVGCLVLVVLRMPKAMVPLGLLLGAFPVLFLMMRRRNRLKKFAAQLPDTLDLLGRALRAGHSLAAGFQMVSQEMPQPTAVEFQRTYDEQNFGVTLDESLKNLGERIPNTDLQFFITAVSVQRQTGGDLAEILDKLGRVIRERYKLFGQVKALTAEGRLSGWILNALPILVLLVLLKLNPKYVMLLFTDPLGRKLLIGAAVMQVLGAIAIHKIVHIKV